MISLTESALDKIKKLINSRENSDEIKGLRVGVRGGGCSGFSYFLNFESDIRESDKSLLIKGVDLIVDKKSYLYLMGTEIDYVDSLKESGFRFNNPNAKRTCGCGESFSV